MLASFTMLIVFKAMTRLNRHPSKALKSVSSDKHANLCMASLNSSTWIDKPAPFWWQYQIKIEQSISWFSFVMTLLNLLFNNLPITPQYFFDLSLEFLISCTVDLLMPNFIAGLGINHLFSMSYDLQLPCPFCDGRIIDAIKYTKIIPNITKSTTNTAKTTRTPLSDSTWKGEITTLGDAYGQCDLKRYFPSGQTFLSTKHNNQILSTHDITHITSLMLALRKCLQ